MQFLRTNTATRVGVGPFFDKTDGVTPEVALTVTACKLTFLVDDGGVPTLVLDVAPTASGGANDMVHVTGDDAGYYDLELAAANVNYLGRAKLAITDAATHCPVFQEFMILPGVVYDALFLGTDLLDVSVTQWLGTAAATPTVAGVPEVDVTHYGGSAGTFASGRAEVNTSHFGGTAGTFASGRPEVNSTHISGDSAAADALELAYDGTAGPVPTFGIIDRGTAQAATGTTLQLRAAAAFADDVIIGSTIVITGGSAGVGQSRQITDYVGATDTATVATWTTTPTGTITYEIYATAPGAAGGAPTAAEVADAVWDEATTAHTTSGTFGEQAKTDVDAILVKAAFLPSATAGAAGGVFIAGSNAATTVNLTGNLTGNVTGSVGSVTGAVGSVTGAVGSVGAGGITAASLASDTITAAKIATDAITAAKIAADAFTAAKFAADVTTELQAGLSTAAALATVSALVDTLETSAAAIKVVTDNLATALELDGAVYRYTVNALELAPSGTGASAASIRAEMDSNSTKLASIDAKTTNLPTDPADQSLVIVATDAIMTRLGTAGAGLTAITAKTDLIPASPAAVGSAMTLTSGERTAIADAHLGRDLSLVTGAAARSPLNAHRFNRNKFTIVGATLTVYAEDDTTVAWTAVITQTAGNPVSASDPA